MLIHYLEALYKHKNRIVISMSFEKDGVVSYTYTCNISETENTIKVLRNLADRFEAQCRALREAEDIINE